MSISCGACQHYNQNLVRMETRIRRQRKTTHKVSNGCAPNKRILRTVFNTFMLYIPHGMTFLFCFYYYVSNVSQPNKGSHKENISYDHKNSI